MQTLRSCVFVGRDFIFVFVSFFQGKMLEKLKNLTIYLGYFLSLASNSEFCFLHPSSKNLIRRRLYVLHSSLFSYAGQMARLMCTERAGKYFL